MEAVRAAHIGRTVVRVVGETELAASVPVAIQFQNVPSDLEVMAEPLDRVFLRLRGPATRLNIRELDSGNGSSRSCRYP